MKIMIEYKEFIDRFIYGTYESAVEQLNDYVRSNNVDCIVRGYFIENECTYILVELHRVCTDCG